MKTITNKKGWEHNPISGKFEKVGKYQTLKAMFWGITLAIGFWGFITITLLLFPDAQ